MVGPTELSEWDDLSWHYTSQSSLPCLAPGDAIHRECYSLAGTSEAAARISESLQQGTANTLAGMRSHCSAALLLGRRQHVGHISVRSHHISSQLPQALTHESSEAPRMARAQSVTGSGGHQPVFPGPGWLLSCLRHYVHLFSLTTAY